MNTQATEIPDLLRRFVPTPHWATSTLGDVEITLQTNDVEFIGEMRRAEHASHNGVCVTCLSVRLVRDLDAPRDVSQKTFLSAWPLGVLSLGPGTVLAIDCERHEVLGFVAGGIPAAHVVGQLLPMLFNYYRGASPARRRMERPS